MNRYSHRIVATVLAGPLAGCFGPPDLPSELEVALPGGTKQSALVNSGAVVLENSTWSAFRKEDNPENEPTGEDDAFEPSPYGGFLNGGLLARLDPNVLMFRGHFVEGGRAKQVTDNAFYFPEIFGTRLPIDGQFHSTRVPFLEFAAVSFGATAESQFGTAIPADVRFFGIQLGTAIVYSWGTIQGDRIDGTFGYQADLLPLPDLLLGSGADQYPFYMQRDP